MNADLFKRHPELVQDLLRILSIHVVIHIMLCAEGAEVVGNRNVVALLLYTCLGVAFYHLLAKVILENNVLKPEPKKAEVDQT